MQSFQKIGHPKASLAQLRPLDLAIVRSVGEEMIFLWTYHSNAILARAGHAVGGKGGCPLKKLGAEVFIPITIGTRGRIGQPLRGWEHRVPIFRGLHPRLFTDNRSAVHQLRDRSAVFLLHNCSAVYQLRNRIGLWCSASTPEGLSLNSRRFQPPDVAGKTIQPRRGCPMRSALPYTIDSTKYANNHHPHLPTPE